MNGHLESLGRVRLQGILLLVVVFVIGVLVGTALERVREARPAPPPPFRPASSPPGWRKQFRLTDEQDRRIHQILERGRPRTDAILDQFLPRLRAVTDSIRAELRVVLTPDQQREFDRLRPPLAPHPRDRRPPSGGSLPGGPPPGGPPPQGGPPRSEPPPGGPR